MKHCTHASVSKSLTSASLWALQLTQRIPHGRALCFFIPRSLLLSKFLLCSRSISSFLRQVPAALSFAFHIPLLEQKLPDASFQTLVFMLEQHQPVPYPQISLLCSLQWGSKLLCKKIEKKSLVSLGGSSQQKSYVYPQTPLSSFPEENWKIKLLIISTSMSKQAGELPSTGTACSTGYRQRYCSFSIAYRPHL